MLLILKALAPLVLIISVSVASASAQAQQLPPALFSEMKWRLIGPFRAGRALTATGVSGNPALYYFGSVGGGVWKTTDAGMTWEPIFDSQSIASIGAMAVAASDPNIIYVGTGEADMREDITYGDGVYKSTDGGKSWKNVGLKDSQQIGRILIHPNNPDVAYVASLGHAFGPNGERGVFRTIDGGKNWTRILYKDDDTGAIDLAMNPTDPNVIYAAMWQTRRPPWNVYPPSNGPGSGLYKTSDGGDNWQPLSGGLPKEGLGRIGIAVAPSEPTRVYAIVDAEDGGLYRSDDAGKSWAKMDGEQRIWVRGWYFGVVEVDPKNADELYVPNTTLYKSTNGGKSFTAFRGAPGGDDYHGMWIAPEDSKRMIVATDQGTILTLNGGRTWSSWYNQPTGQMYHVSTDKRFPYWVYGAQQDSGAIAVPSRSSYASITERDWKPLSAGSENGMIAPDPVNTNIVFGGEVMRFDWTTMQGQDIGPSISRPGPFRQTWTLPLVFSPVDPKKLYFSHQAVFRSRDGGATWDQISPDLTRESPEVPKTLDPVTASYGLASPRKGVVYAIGPSPLDPNMVWAGTDDGKIHVTHNDGKSWTDVTPPQLTSWSKVGIIEPSHFDKDTAYAAIDRHRVEDMRAYVYRTRDGGKTWQALGKGIPEGSFVNAVREDTVRKGLLFAGTELGMYVSFDEGDNWQPLQMNLPAASVRDMVVQGDDLVIGTHGRAFWILDNIEPLRQATERIAAGDAYLFKPQEALRIRPGVAMATPYPLEIPHGDNPPNGAMLEYYLNSDSDAPVVLEILDAKGSLVRRYSSDDKFASINESALDFPGYWVKPPQAISAKAGMHRFLWDLRFALPRGVTARRGGIWVVPGRYIVRLTVDGKAYTQPLVVKMDPRVQISQADLNAQLVASQEAVALSAEVAKAVTDASEILNKVVQASAAATEVNARTLKAFAARLEPILGPVPQSFGIPITPVNTDHKSLRYVAAGMRQVLGALQSADAVPTPEHLKALAHYRETANKTLAELDRLVRVELPNLHLN